MSPSKEFGTSGKKKAKKKAKKKKKKGY